jgi:hypothetical protein
MSSCRPQDLKLSQLPSGERSARKSEAVWYRISGSFSDALSMIRARSLGTEGFAALGGRCGLCMIAAMTGTDVLPWNGRPPVTISYSTVPSENRSERASIYSPQACSGNM